MSLNFEIRVSPSLEQFLTTRPESVTAKCAERMTSVFDRFRAKQLYNLSGGKLQPRTGRLRESLSKPEIGIGDARVEATLRVGEGLGDYPSALEFGAGVHDILATKSALRFQITGKEFFRKQVHHPRQEMLRYFYEPVDSAVEELGTALHEGIMEAFEGK
jgi:hypothetical protein